MKSGEGRARRPRRLSEEEQSLWKAMTRAIEPLPRRKPRQPSEVSPERAPVEPVPQRKRAEVATPAPKKASAPPLAPLDRRLRQRLARGSEAIDRRLDLHGMTQRQAHRALLQVLRSVQAEGGKTVLVVTGKGARAAESDPFAERGVLRRLVPAWLAQLEFRDLIVGFEPAHVTHGGSGALYVRLRKRR